MRSTQVAPHDEHPATLEIVVNRSIYSTCGIVDDYWRNDDELDITIQYVANAMADGRDLLHIGAWFSKRA
jgi:hypothetical protein